MTNVFNIELLPDAVLVPGGVVVPDVGPVVHGVPWDVGGQRVVRQPGMAVLLDAVQVPANERAPEVGGLPDAGCVPALVVVPKVGGVPDVRLVPEVEGALPPIAGSAPGLPGAQGTAPCAQLAAYAGVVGAPSAGPPCVRSAARRVGVPAQLGGGPLAMRRGHQRLPGHGSWRGRYA